MQFSEGVTNLFFLFFLSPPYCVTLLHWSLRCNIQFQNCVNIKSVVEHIGNMLEALSTCCYWRGLSSVAGLLSLNWVAVYLDDLMVHPPYPTFFLSPEKQRHCVGHKGTLCSLMRSCRDRACGNTDALGNTTGLGNFSRRNPKNRTVKITLGGQTAERSRDRAALSSGFTVWNTQDPKG